MAKESVGKALKDANIPYTKIKQAVIGYVYGDSTCGQRALYEGKSKIYNLKHKLKISL